jgi:hypothetical protein
MGSIRPRTGEIFTLSSRKSTLNGKNVQDMTHLVDDVHKTAHSGAKKTRRARQLRHDGGLSGLDTKKPEWKLLNKKGILL